MRVYCLPILAVLLLLLCTTETSRADDLQVVRQRILNGLLPEKTDSLLQQADELTSKIQTDGTWLDIDYASQVRSDWSVLKHLQKTLLLAKANAVQRSDQRVKALNAALAWWLKNDPQNPNWWHNQIGVPQALGEIAVLLGDSLSDEQRERIIEILKRSKGETWTGQNQIWTCGIHIIRGILEKNEETTANAYRRLYGEVRVGNPQGEGIMPDSSFHQHGSQFYSGGYGLAFANDVGRFIVYSVGTKFQVPREVIDVYSAFMLDGERWMTRGERFDHSARGREITRAITVLSTIGRVYGLPNVVHALSEADLPRKQEFIAFADQLAGKTANSVSGNRHFWCSDYMSHQRKDFVISIRMYSSRTLNTELVNNEGKLSHHLADGCTMIYRTGDEYTGIFPVWDWLKIPGTTVEQSPISDLEKNPQIKTTADFVGGVSDGTIGLAAQDIDHSGLRAKKMWLCLDEGIVALGAGISCDGKNPVVTTLDQTLLRTRQGISDRQSAHGGFIYSLLSPGKLQCTAGPQTGRWSDIGTGSDAMETKDVFKLWIDHGVAPRDASYAYTVFNQASPAPDVEVIVNTPDLQAVRSRQGGVLGAAFWKAGKLELAENHSIEVDQPCLLLVRGNQITVSNPRNAGIVVRVQVNGSTLVLDLPAGAMAGTSVAKTLPN